MTSQSRSVAGMAELKRHGPNSEERTWKVALRASIFLCTIATFSLASLWITILPFSDVALPLTMKRVAPV